MYNKFEIAID